MRSRKGLEGFGLSKRLVARLGALLARKVDVTETVLELGGPRSVLSKVLLDQSLLKKASSFDSVVLARLCGKHGVDEETRLQVVESGGWRTIALEDEVLAEGAWEGEEGAEVAARGELVHRGRFKAEEGAAEDLFTAKEMDRLKLQALTSAEPKEKVEALRKLSFAPVPDGEKAEFLLGRLSDPDSPVRTEAAQLLVRLGLSQDIADAIRELEGGTEEEKLFAVGRMSRILARKARGVEIGAGLIALIGRLREEKSAQVRRRLLECLEEASPIISDSPEHERQLIRLLVSILPQDFAGLDVSVRRVLRALGRHAPERVASAIWDEIDKTSDRRITVHLLLVLAFLPVASVGKERLAVALAEEIAKSQESEVDFRAMGGVLQRMGDGAIGPLLSVFKRASKLQKRYIVRLLGDTCRFEHVSVPLKEETAKLYLKILDGEQIEVRMAVMETQLPCDMELSDETRARSSVAFLENIHAFTFPADIENVEYSTARMGLAAADSILARLDPKLPPRERVRAVRLLGELCRVESERTARGSEKPVQILRALQKLSFEDFPDKNELLVAIGKICSTRFVSRQVVEVAARNVWQRGQGRETRVAAYEAMGWIASSRRCDAKRVREAVETFKQELLKEPPSFSSEAKVLNDEEVFEIGPEAAHYTEIIPSTVKGLERIALGHPESRGLREEIARFLMDRWRAMMTWKTIWGPGSVGAVMEGLKGLGSDGRTPVNLRVEIVKALAGRLRSVPVMLALGEIFAADDSSPDLGVYASGVAMKLLRRKGETGEFRDEERDIILKTLAKIVGRRVVETRARGTGNIREIIIEELFAGLRDRVEDTFESLVDLRDRSGLPDELKALVAEKLAVYSSLVLY